MGQDDLKPDGRSVRLGGEAAGEDDVEGHGSRKAYAVDPEGVSRPRASDEEDVEGHGSRKAYAIDPEGVSRPRASDEDDVEGHRRPA
jgi:hypothetical protein